MYSYHQYIIPGVNLLKKGVAIVVHKSVVRSVVKKIIYNDRIIVIKLQAEPINILTMQVYMPTSEHEDDEVDELYGIIEEFLKKIERVTQTPL
jgi:exonuclease III